MLGEKLTNRLDVDGLYAYNVVILTDVVSGSIWLNLHKKILNVVFATVYIPKIMSVEKTER